MSPRSRLEMAAYDVRTAKNGVEAMKRVSELRPDAMVLDINMPEMDGFGVLDTLRTTEGIKPIPAPQASLVGRFNPPRPATSSARAA